MGRLHRVLFGVLTLIDSHGCSDPFVCILKDTIYLWVFLCVLVADKNNNSKTMMQSQTLLSSEVFLKMCGDRFWGKKEVIFQ